MKTPHRIDFLDGLRGIAILSVVVFHAYGSWPDWLPFGDRFITFPFRFGYVGVNLFFLISGFVILMTLERCSSLAEFGWRRWIRLFPAMLAASVVILTFDVVVGSGPLSERSAQDLIPGIAFISPPLIHALSGIQLHSMDDTFWSLYVEVCFYAVAGTVFFLRGRQWTIGVVLAIFVTTFAASGAQWLGWSNRMADRFINAAQWMGFSWFGWFASGALLYLSRSSGRRSYALAGLALGLFCAAASDFIRLDVFDHMALVCAVLLFFAAFESRMLQDILANRSLLFLGAVSYPLYLVHNNIMIGLERDVAARFSFIPDLMIPIVPVAIVVAMAWVIVRFVEQPFQRIVRARKWRLA